MSKRIFFFIAIFIFSCTAFTFAAQQRSYTANLVPQKPVVLDGKLDDEFWKDLKQESDFLIVGGEKKATKQTYFKIGYNKKAVYIGIKCEEPDMDKIKCGGKDKGALWEDDSIEIFLFPDNQKTYYQFIVNAEGYKFNTKDKMGNLPLWDWQADTYQGKDFYSVELIIPFTILHSYPNKAREEWTINIGRNILTGPQEERLTCWAHLKNSFHEPKNFAQLIFSQKIPGEKITEELLPYYKKKIRANMGKINLLQSDLTKDRKEKKKDVQKCMEQKEELKDSFSKIDRFNLPELKLLLENSNKLLQRMRTLKSEIRKESIRNSLFE